MYNTPILSAMAIVTDFLASNPSPEQILAYKFPDPLQARLDELLELNGEEALNNEQEIELDEIVQMDEMLTLLKAKVKLAKRGK